MARAHVKVHTGGIAAAAEFYQAAADAEPDHRRIEAARAIGSTPSSIACPRSATPAPRSSSSATSTTSSLYRDLIRRGVSEYLVAPVDLDAHHPDDRRSLCRSLDGQPLGRTIAFVGGKGGVGSSMVAHNVAWAIARSFENDVVVADLDLAFGTAGLDFNQDPAQGHRRGGPLARAARRHLPRSPACRAAPIISACSPRRRRSTAPTTSTRRPSSRSSTSPRAACRPSSSTCRMCGPRWIKKHAARRRRDRSHGRARSRQSPQRQEPHRSPARRRASNDAPPRLVINKSGMLAKRPEIKVDDFATALDLTPTAVIPFDAQLFGTAANNGQMIAETDPKSPIAASFDLIARSRHRPRRGQAPEARRRIGRCLPASAARRAPDEVVRCSASADPAGRTAAPGATAGAGARRRQPAVAASPSPRPQSPHRRPRRRRPKPARAEPAAHRPPRRSARPAAPGAVRRSENFYDIKIDGLLGADRHHRPVAARPPRHRVGARGNPRHRQRHHRAQEHRDVDRRAGGPARGHLQRRSRPRSARAAARPRRHRRHHGQRRPPDLHRGRRQGSADRRSASATTPS